ncbi:PEBP-like protein [Calocera cornea HHB12733]|uniref:PEBP-like protein n=1 Tax=Calocera cornea HHB12733 TaxID=1353952 RepID=A0A165E7X8_9BASI|nr:PEBP-like protein [Calocera cornea HHB12733]
MHLPLASLALLAIPLTAALCLRVPHTLPIPPIPELNEIKRSFKDARIVPDVIDEFDPSAQVFLEWELDMAVTPGKSVNKSDSASTPILTASNLPFGHRGPYLILTVDPDAPSHSDPKNSPFRHFLQTDLWLRGELSDELPYAWKLENESTPLSEWYPPAPPPGSGPHRYVTLLYAQPDDLDLTFVDWDDRKRFNVKRFAERTGLNEPLAGLWFYVEVEDNDGESLVPADPQLQLVLDGT